MSFVVCISGIDYTVEVNFFNNLEIITEKLISDTYFVTVKNGVETLTFSIDRTNYEKIKLDKKISKILD